METKIIQDVADQQPLLNPQQVGPGSFDYYRDQISDEQYQKIYDDKVQELKARWFSAFGTLNAEQYCLVEHEFIKQLIVDTSELVPAMRLIAHRIEGEKNKKEYSKKVYAIESEDFKPIRYDLREMKLYLKHYFTQRNEQLLITPEYVAVYTQLCKYFLDDESFEGDLNKGLWLYGCVGDGKTSLMKAFSMNQKKSYRVINAEDIAEDYKENGTSILKQYRADIKRPCNPFGQTELALCLDDVGKEGIYKHFGDPLNVVESIVMKRYEAQLTTHFTTNIDTAKAEEIYGKRAVSRLRQMVNIIELPNVDLRK